MAVNIGENKLTPMKHKTKTFTLALLVISSLFSVLLGQENHQVIQKKEIYCKVCNNHLGYISPHDFHSKSWIVNIHQDDLEIRGNTFYCSICHSPFFVMNQPIESDLQWIRFKISDPQELGQLKTGYIPDPPSSGFNCGICKTGSAPEDQMESLGIRLNAKLIRIGKSKKHN